MTDQVSNAPLKNKNSALAGQIRDMRDSAGWKYMAGILSNIGTGIIEQILKPCNDQTPKFTADQILKERLNTIRIVLHAADIEIDTLFLLSAQEQEGTRPLEERLKDMDESFGEQLKKLFPEL